MQRAPFQSFSIPITNEADGKQGVIVFAGDRVGSALLGNTYLARSPGSEVREGSQLQNPWQKCLCRSHVARLSTAAAENTGGVCLQEGGVVRNGCAAVENLPLGHGKTSRRSFVPTTSPGLLHGCWNHAATDASLGLEGNHGLSRDLGNGLRKAVLRQEGGWVVVPKKDCCWENNMGC